MSQKLLYVGDTVPSPQNRTAFILNSEILTVGNLLLDLKFTLDLNAQTGVQQTISF